MIKQYFGGVALTAFLLLPGCGGSNDQVTMQEAADTQDFENDLRNSYDFKRIVSFLNSIKNSDSSDDTEEYKQSIRFMAEGIIRERLDSLSDKSPEYTIAKVLQYADEFSPEDLDALTQSLIPYRLGLYKKSLAKEFENDAYSVQNVDKMRDEGKKVLENPLGLGARSGNDETDAVNYARALLKKINESFYVRNVHDTQMLGVRISGLEVAICVLKLSGWNDDKIYEKFGVTDPKEMALLEDIYHDKASSKSTGAYARFIDARVMAEQESVPNTPEHP